MKTEIRIEAEDETSRVVLSREGVEAEWKEFSRAEQLAVLRVLADLFNKGLSKLSSPHSDTGDADCTRWKW